MATPELASRGLINAHLEPLASSTPVAVGRGPYSSRLHPVLCSRGNSSLQTHRQRIVKEIFDTEHNYISQLTTIVTLFLKPVRVACLLPADTSTTIFSNVEGILSVNLELFSCMRQRSLGEAFSYLGPFLKLYSTYANDYQTANDTLHEWLRRSSEFSQFVSLQESRPECCGLSLPALLITPIQRIPRYKLLLEDLLKNTKTTHPDYSKLNAASAQVAAVASHINEHIRQHENFKKMLSIRNSLTGQYVPGILAPGRKFVQEGRLMKVCRRKAKERMVILFSDMLLYARPNLLEKVEAARTYECRCVLPLLNSTVQVVLGDHRVPGITALFKVANEETSLLFFTQQQEEVFQWAHAIEDTIRALQLAFGSLMTSTRMEQSLYGGDSVENPLNQLQSTRHTIIDDSSPSPYPLMTTLISSHSLEDLRKRDTHSSFSKQTAAGTKTMVSERSSPSYSGNLRSPMQSSIDRLIGTAASEASTQYDSRNFQSHTTQSSSQWKHSESEDPRFTHQDRTHTRPRPKSSTSARPSVASTGTEAGAQRRPHSAAARVRHRAVKAGDGGEEELGPGRERRRRRRKHGHGGKVPHYDDAVVLVNKHVLEGSEGREVEDETAAQNEASQESGYHAVSSGSQTLYTSSVRSSCCVLL